MAQTKRRVSEPTHPTVWAGLALALGGLLVAIYAYTGTRVYDITYFFVALVGGVLAFAGILAAAWGRALGASRRKRAATAAKYAETPGESAPPTVAAPKEKRALLARLVPGGGKKDAAPAKPVFAFKRRGAEATAAVAVQEAGAPVPVTERLTIRCPQCESQFTTEGVRPFTATCPQCAFSAQV